MLNNASLNDLNLSDRPKKTLRILFPPNFIANNQLVDAGVIRAVRVSYLLERAEPNKISFFHKYPDPLFLSPSIPKILCSPHFLPLFFYFLTSLFHLFLIISLHIFPCCSLFVAKSSTSMIISLLCSCFFAILRIHTTLNHFRIICFLHNVNTAPSLSLFLT